MRQNTGRVLLPLCVAVLLVGCGRERSEGGAEAGQLQLTRIGAFAFADGVLYRWEAEEPRAIAALPGTGRAPDTLDACASAFPALGEARFRNLAPGPAGRVVAWEAGGPGACVGVADLEGSARVIGQWTEALPDSLLWAPSGRYLAIGLRHAGGRRSLEVYDVWTGGRLEMPWEGECAVSDDACDVRRADWLGGTLLNVEIRLGPDEVPVPFEVNVKALSEEPQEDIANEGFVSSSTSLAQAGVVA